jgi:glycine cleavage system regulatory protein
MFAVATTVGLPAGARIPTLRAGFPDYCDDLKFDAAFEPART